MINETPNQEILSSEAEPQKGVTVNWVEYRKLAAEFMRKQALLVALFLTLMATVAPHIIANEEEFDQALCSLRQEIVENAQQTTITCIDEHGESVEINFESMIRQFDVLTYSKGQMDNPPFFTSEYLSDIHDPNFNCHSATLQHLQELVGIDFGASRTTWLDSGLDAFLLEFGEEVVRLDDIPDEMTEDVVDASAIQTGDIVLFFDHNGKLIHSATVDQQAVTEEGITYWRILNKLGESAELASSIDDMALSYDTRNEFGDENDPTGSIVVYRVDPKKMRQLFASPN